MESFSRKALIINQKSQIYGTFAEIGGGQEVARQFFQAGLASQTVAKTMSAYDMTFSDEIYGKGDRYVSQFRLKRMLEHEYSLLHERLHKVRGKETCFFAFADTVATSSRKKGAHSHGWLGVRFQTKPGAPTNDVAVHVELLDQNRLQQQEALSFLGVNLLYSCFFNLSDPLEFLKSLTEDIGTNRVEIDIVRFDGPDCEHIDNRLVSLQMIRQGLTPAAVFNEKSEVLQPGDLMWGKPIVLQRGTFRPITSANLEIAENAIEQLKKSSSSSKKPPINLFEISMKSLEEDGKLDEKDFLDRVDTLTALGHCVMVSDFTYFYEIKEFIAKCTQEEISFVVGASHLEKLFDENYYKGLEGGILEAFGTLFDHRTHMYVYPYKREDLCETASTFNPKPELVPLFKYLYQNKKITDLLGCDDVDTSIHSSHVREMLASGGSQWEELVPKPVKKLIKDRKLFGYQS